MIYFYRLLVFLLIFIVSYLFGSIPNGLIIGKIFFHKDIRQYGSRNVGGTNTGRTLGKKAGVITIVLDMMKLLIPFFTCFFLFTLNPTLIEFMGNDINSELNAFGRGNTLCELTYYIAALGVIIGHGYSIFLKFKGGKVVSTFAATQIAMSYLTIPIFGGLFFLVLKLKKQVSRSSIIVGGLITLFSWIIYFIYLGTYNIGDYSTYLIWFGMGPLCSIYYPILMSVAYLILVYKHKENIKRIKEGKENQISWMK